MRLLFLIFLTGLSTFAIAHPMHISLTNIDINNSSINIQIRIDEHDFTHYLNKKNKTVYDNTAYLTNNEAIKIINEYIINKLKISINNSPIDLENLEIQLSESNIYISYASKFASPLKTIQIINKLLLDNSSNQKNLVILKFNNLEQGIEFNNDKWEETIEF